jgi:hypothetical protein
MTKQRMTIHNRTGRLLVVSSSFLICGLAAGTLQAQNSAQDQKPVNKVAVQFVGTNIVSQSGAEGPGYQDLVSAQVRTVQTNDLLIDIGLQVDLKTTSTPASSETALLNLIVYVDGIYISPSFVKYGYQHAVQSPGEPDNGFTLERQDALSFSFLAGDLPPGVHTILATAYLVGSGVGGGAAGGSVGQGTMTVETVHVITDPNDIPTLK